MNTISWNIPREAFFALKGTTEDVSLMLRMASAVKLYEMGRISSGIAAQLAGIPRTVFLARLADFGVDTFQLNEDDLQRRARLG